MLLPGLHGLFQSINIGYTQVLSYEIFYCYSYIIIIIDILICILIWGPGIVNITFICVCVLNRRNREVLVYFVIRAGFLVWGVFTDLSVTKHALWLVIRHLDFLFVVISANRSVRQASPWTVGYQRVQCIYYRSPRFFYRHQKLVCQYFVFINSFLFSVSVLLEWLKFGSHLPRLHRRQYCRKEVLISGFVWKIFSSCLCKL